jgi:hypothetical protein
MSDSDNDENCGHDMKLIVGWEIDSHGHDIYNWMKKQKGKRLCFNMMTVVVPCVGSDGHEGETLEDIPGPEAEIINIPDEFYITVASHSRDGDPYDHHWFLSFANLPKSQNGGETIEIPIADLLAIDPLLIAKGLEVAKQLDCKHEDLRVISALHDHY